MSDVDQIDDPSDAIVLLVRLERELNEKFAYSDPRLCGSNVSELEDNMDMGAIAILKASRNHLARKTFTHMKNQLMRRWRLDKL